MEIKVWILVSDNGDGSQSAELFPSLFEAQQKEKEYEDEEFRCNMDGPIATTLDTNDYDKVTLNG